MNFEISNKIEDIRQVINAWHELERMREHCQNPEALDEAQAGLDKLVVAFLEDMQETQVFSHDGCFSTFNDIDLILMVKNVFLVQIDFFKNERINERADIVLQAFNALLVTAAEELVKEYSEVTADEDSR